MVYKDCPLGLTTEQRSKGCTTEFYIDENLQKLEQIEKIVKRVESLHPEIAIGDREGIRLIREVLNG